MLGNEPLRYERRVAFCDTDAMGVVHHANYLRYVEEARVAWLRHRGLIDNHYPHTERVFAVLHYQMWHFRPARFDDLLTITMQVRNVGLKVQFQYAIFKGEERIAEAETLHIPLGANFKPARLDQRTLKELEKEPWTETWLSNS